MLQFVLVSFVFPHCSLFCEISVAIGAVLHDIFPYFASDCAVTDVSGKDMCV